MHMMNPLAIALLVPLLRWAVYCLDENEPICTSRFDYDHKMLQKMLMLEMEQNKIKLKMEEQTKTIELQSNYIEDQRKLIDNLDLTLKEEKSDVERKLNKLHDISFEDRSGATYIRWGRTTCPGNMTELVYKGYSGGSHYTYSGGASTYLCLPEDPLWNVYEDATQASGTVWGAEYELGVHGRNMNNFFGKAVAERDVPCSVCRTKRNSVVMIPARNRCHDGWTLEYQGYLTGGHDSHHASEYVCLDGDPETVAGSEANKDGKLFYFIEARCGILPCPPYVNGRELTCAVCSK